MDLKTALAMIKQVLQSLDIKATHDNCDKLNGVYATIDEAIFKLNSIGKGGVNEGNNQPEEGV